MFLINLSNPANPFPKERDDWTATKTTLNAAQKTNSR